MKESQDAYGQAMLDFFNGLGGYEIVERDDGHISITWELSTRRGSRPACLQQAGRKGAGRLTGGVDPLC
jgi:hypothetical protein